MNTGRCKPLAEPADPLIGPWLRRPQKGDGEGGGRGSAIHCTSWDSAA